MSASSVKRIALIGGAGFIGHHLALKLQERGHDVHIIDGMSINNILYFSSTVDHIPNRELYMKMINERLDMLSKAEVPLHVEDARDYFRLSLALDKIEPQVIV